MALGEVLTTGISLAVMVRTLQVFPFDFGDSTVDWAFWVRAFSHPRGRVAQQALRGLSGHTDRCTTVAPTSAVQACA